MTNFITLDGDTSTCRYLLIVDYLPVHEGKPWTDAPQFCHLPWAGDVAAAQQDLITSAQTYFTAKYGAGQDVVTAARIYDRGAAWKPTAIA